MPKNTEKTLGVPTVILLLIGGIFIVILFHFMFQFADQKNPLMVILTALLVVVVSMAVSRGTVYLSRRK